MERGGPAVSAVSDHKEGKGEMTKASITLQDLRRRIYVKAKAETSWRFWGLYVHVCKKETLREAYALAKENNGAPGSDGVTFEVIDAQGVESFLEKIRDELTERTYKPLPVRRERGKFCVSDRKPVMEKNGELGERVLPFLGGHDS